jgi:hypothetical protein
MVVAPSLIPKGRQAGQDRPGRQPESLARLLCAGKLTEVQADQHRPLGACQNFCVPRGHEMIPKGKLHDRSNEYDEEDQETEGAEAFSG